MNSTLKRAPGKQMAQPSDERALLTRGSWKTLLVLALVTLLTVASAFATPSVLVGFQGINQPRGMVLVTVPNPNGGAPLRDYWVADQVAGFCRLDNGILRITTCFAAALSEPSDFQFETNGVNGSNGYVFVAGTGGVFRFNFIPDPTDNTKTAIDTANIVTFLGAGSVFTNNVSIGKPPKTEVAKLGPDGKLYVGLSDVDVWRVLNPLSPSFTIAGNQVERVGVSGEVGGVITSMAFVGHDLWLVDVGFINKIPDADLCFYTFPKCAAQLQFRTLQVHAGMTSDQFISTIPDGRYLYMGNGSRVIRYDTTTQGLIEVWSRGGLTPAAPTPPGQGYSLILGIGFVQQPTLLPDGSTGHEMTIVNDPVVNALFPRAPQIPPRNGIGLTWSLPANPAPTAESCVEPVGAPVPPPCVSSPIGQGGPELVPNPIPARRSILLASGITHPRGLLFLQGNWWVSDEALGFCRIDQNPVTGAGSLSNCFQPDPTFIPGQTAADAPDPLTGTQNVYLPDASGVSASVYRLIFTPSPTGGSLALSGILAAAGRRGTAIATVALPTGPFNDGALYMGYSDDPFIQKITSPATAPGAPVQVVRTFKGVGVISMAFNGNDLYLSELGPPPIAGQFIKKGQVTVLVKASPSADNGRAVPVKRAIARLQAPQIIVENPGGFTMGPTTGRPFCLPPPGVKLSPSVPADPATTPAFYIGTLGLPADGVLNPGVTGGLGELPEVDQYDFVCTTQVPWVTEGALDPTLSLNTPLGSVTALGFSGFDANAVLAIGDDPSVIVPTQTRERGVLRKNGPPGTGAIGQGHVFIVP